MTGQDTPLYDALAATYDRSIAEPTCRRAYELLGRELVAGIPVPAGALVVDAGCGTGRWAEWLLGLGHDVVGIEQSPGMIAQIRARDLGPRFRLVEESMEAVELAPGSADLVLAIGSVQYVGHPAAMLRRMSGWTRPGGTVAVMVDSLVALVLELLRTGRREEAFERLRTRFGCFRFGEHTAEPYLYDQATLRGDMLAAGLTDLRFHGLAAGATATSRADLAARMAADEGRTLADERLLAADPALVDCGLHILAIGSVPSA